MYIYICYTLHCDLWTSAGVWNGVADATTQGIDWTIQSINLGVIYLWQAYITLICYDFYILLWCECACVYVRILVPVLDSCVAPNVRIIWEFYLAKQVGRCHTDHSVFVFEMKTNYYLLERESCRILVIPNCVMLCGGSCDWVTYHGVSGFFFSVLSYILEFVQNDGTLHDQFWHNFSVFPKFLKTSFYWE